MVTHPSIKRAQCRAGSLMQLSIMPNCHLQCPINIIIISLPSVVKIRRVKSKVKMKSWSGHSLSSLEKLLCNRMELNHWTEIFVGKESWPLGYLLREKLSFGRAHTKTQWLTRSEGRVSLLRSVETCDLTESNCHIWLIFDRLPVQLLHHLSEPPRSHRSPPISHCDLETVPTAEAKSRSLHAAKVSASASQVIYHHVSST